MTPPKKIKILSDDNILEFVGESANKKGVGVFTYEYTKSITKQGVKVSFTEHELVKQINSGFFTKAEK